MPIRPYSDYSESPTPWLERAPRHWQALPNRTVFREVVDRGYADADMLSVTISAGVIPQARLLSGSSKKDSSNEDKSSYKLVSPGDIAYNKMRAWQGAIGASQLRGIISPAYIVMRPRESQNPRYFHHLFRTPMFIKEAERWSYGIVSDQWSLRASDFKQIYSLVPPRDEQDAIVHYLDHLDAKVNCLVRNKRRLIALLNEQKQAIIQQAVTRGLDESVPTKPSGIEWVGPVPAHWKVGETKHWYDITLGKMHQGEQASENDQHVPYFKSQHVQWFAVRTQDLPSMWASKADLSSVSVRDGDLLVCEGGEAGRGGIVWNVPPNAIVEKSIHRVRGRNGSSVEYLQYVLRLSRATGWFDAINNKSTIAHFTREKFGWLQIPMPPVAEQGAIVAFIREQSGPIDETIARIEREIDLIREYRNRLVADVVTGQLDVRAAAASLPDLDPLDSAEPDSPELDMDEDGTGLDELPDEDADAAD